ncbi:MAG TPA: hypothetical protein VFG83_07020 [Kofleriaceae bacterium]|nr:hypothetical protein [Kofleriaceae bacterium]
MTAYRRQMFLGAAAVLVLGALVVLAAWAQADADIEIDDRALAQAKLAHQRDEARAQALSRRAQARAKRQRAAIPPPPITVPEPEPEPEPEPVRRPEIRIRPRVHVAAKPGNTEKILDARMDHANFLYDRKRYEEAISTAKKVLEDVDNDKDRVRMLRVVVSSACIMGDADQAEDYAGDLPDHDFSQMKTRCRGYGVDLER